VCCVCAVLCCAAVGAGGGVLRVSVARVRRARQHSWQEGGAAQATEVEEGRGDVRGDVRGANGEGHSRTASVPGLEPRSIFRGKNIVITPQSRAPPLSPPPTQRHCSSAVDSNGWVAPGRSTTDQTSPTHSWQEGEAEVEPRSIFRGKNLSSCPIVAPPCPATPTRHRYRQVAQRDGQRGRRRSESSVAPRLVTFCSVLTVQTAQVCIAQFHGRLETVPKVLAAALMPRYRAPSGLADWLADWWMDSNFTLVD
jgi:hypothetical protein